MVNVTGPALPLPHHKLMMMTWYETPILLFMNLYHVYTVYIPRLYPVDVSTDQHNSPRGGGLHHHRKE